MKYVTLTASGLARFVVAVGLLLAPLGAARAQAPAWAATLAPDQLLAGAAVTRGTAVNAAGDVFIVGTYNGQVGFGSTTLTSAGSQDVFVAKWNTAAGTWAWAASGGGTGLDQGLGIAVSGTGVYVTGSITNTSANANAVLFGGTTLNGASTTSSNDVFVVKYTDATTSATYNWATAGGGTGNDQGQGIAVSGTGVYVTGYITNSSANVNAVQFGGTALNGASSSSNFDVFVAKYTDATTSATYNWATAGGGLGADLGQGIAVSGTGVYVTGFINNSSANVNAVQFGGSALNGASTTSSNDVFVAKYTDATTSAIYNWARAGGGIGTDQGYGIAVSGTGVYVTGVITNTSANANTVQFGGTTLNGATTTNSLDVFVAKYTDATTSATYNWATAGGGTGNDQGQGITVSGTGVYVTGYISNSSTNASAVQFGGTTLNGASTANNPDVLVARYTDATTSATYNWATAGGGTGNDQGYGIAVSGSTVQVGFGTGTGNGTYGSSGPLPLNAAGRGALNATTGAWQNAGTGRVGGTSQVRATALNANGDVFITGSYSGQVAFGSTTLTSAGSTDVFVAKWNTAAGTWAWAVGGGGTSGDQGQGIAVSGTGVYVTGYINNSSANASAVQFGGSALNGASTTSSNDVFVAKYTDATTSATYNWATAGGGTVDDRGLGIAVSGTGVYVTGFITNTTANASAVQFGGSTLNGASTTSSQDVLVAKYTDAGSSATYNWATAGGGTGTDQGNGIAVSGTGVNVTGSISNSSANAQAVQFGGTALNGASTNTSTDVFVAKYTDATTSATYNWATAGGGLGADQGQGIAVSGTGVYVTGSISNSSTNANAVQFGGTTLNGASITNNPDVLVAKYTDAGSSATYNWATAGGGTSIDVGQGIAVSGTGVYVTGYITNSSANASTVQFGGSTLNGATTTNSQDVLVAKYTDATTSATYNWATAGGGTGTDLGLGIAVSGNLLVTAGYVAPPATFGSNTVTAGTTQLAAGGILALGPVITGFAPASGVAGTSVTLTGLGLSGATSVSVNGVAVVPTGVSSTGLTFVVPAGASNTQGITVTTPSGTSAAYTGFVVRLNVASTNPVANARTAPVASSAVALTFTEPVTAASIAPTATAGIKVFSAQVGGRKAGSFSLSGNTASYTSSLASPRTNFRPGEVVNVTVPATVLGAGGLAAGKRVYQFTTTVSGTGRGNFLPPATNPNPAVGSQPISVAVGDVDGDGDLDLLTANYGGGGGTTVSVRLNDGTGNYTAPATNPNPAVGANPFSVALGDVDGDGDLDLLTANTNTVGTVSVRLNDGTGNFTAPATNPNPAVGNNPGSVAVGDVDGDGDLDLLTANSGNGTVSVRLNDGTGNFTAPATNPNPAVGTIPRSIAVGDVDGDGDLDLLTANYGGGGGTTVSVRLNDGTGNFTAPATNPDPTVGSGPISVAVGDVDGDGDLDLLTANYGGGGGGTTVSVRLNDGAGNFTAPATNPEPAVGSQPISVAVGDVDGDGDLDLLTSNYNASGTVSVRLNDGTGNFTTPATNPNPAVGSRPFSVAVGDVDGDGDLDLLTANYSAATVSVRLNDGTGNFTAPAINPNPAVGTNPIGLAVGDVDGDGDLDLLTSNFNASGTVSVRLNDGTGNFTAPATNPNPAVGTNARSVAVGDVDGDGDLDLLCANSGAATVSVRLNDGTGNFTAPATNPNPAVGTQPISVAVGDVDGDGDLDMLAVNNGDITVSVRLNQQPAPTLTALSPNAELAGMPVTITGTGFTAGSTVSFGGVAATGVVFNSSTSLTATVPAGAAAGASTVAVTTSGGPSTAPPAFTVLSLYSAATAGACLSTTPYVTTGDGAWHYLLAGNGQVVAALRDTRAALGTVAVDFLVMTTPTAVRQDGRARKYLDRNFHLTATNPVFTGSSVQVRFYGLTSEFARLQAADPAVTYAGLKSSQYSGPNEDCQLTNNNFQTGQSRILATTSSTPGSGVPWFVADVTVPDHFSEFYLTGSNVPLPVELTAFTAERQGGGAVATAWATASERNNQGFVVQRSPDGQAFRAVSRLVAGASSSAVGHAYAWTDAAAPAGPLYYRLLQLDADGTSTYSNVVRVGPASAGAAPVLTLWPNPASGAVQVRGAAPQVPITLLDATGRVVRTITTDDAGTVTLPLTGLPSGVYVVRAGTQTQRLVVE